MKAETIITKYAKLGQYLKSTEGLAEKLTATRPSILDAVDGLLYWGYIRPNQKTGRGRYTHMKELGNEISNVCNLIGLELVEFNDAPRGGKSGVIWFLKGEWVETMDRLGRVCVHAVGDGYVTGGIHPEQYCEAIRNFLEKSTTGYHVEELKAQF